MVLISGQVVCKLEMRSPGDNTVGGAEQEQGQGLSPTLHPHPPPSTPIPCVWRSDGCGGLKD